MTSPTPMPGTTTEASSDSGLEIRDVLRAILRFKWVVLAFTAAGALIAVFWTMRQPKVYQATCSLEYNPHPPRPLQGAIQDFSDPFSSYWNNREFFETQNLVIGSRAVADRVVRKLSLHHDASFMGLEDEVGPDWAGVTVERAASRLRRLISVEQVPETRLVRIRVNDGNPERAAMLANAVAESYIEKSVEDRLGSTVSAIDWLSTQLDNIRGRLDASERSLHDFKQEHNVLSVSLEDRRNIVANDLQRLSEALTETRRRRIELSARVERIRHAAGADPLEIPIRVAAESEALPLLRQQHRQLHSQRESAAVHYGDSHPEIQSLDVQLTRTRAQLATELASVVESAEADLREVRRIETGLRSALEEANQAGLALNLREIEYNRLSRERENNEKLYGVLLQRTTEANLTKMLRLTHAHVVDQALARRNPIKPNLQMNLAGGTTGGLLFGFLVALVLMRLDRTVKSIEDVEELGMTVLGIVPKIADEGDSPKTGGYYGRRKKARDRKRVEDGRKDVIVHTHPMSSVAECCRTIRTNLTFMSADDPLRTLVVTSPGPREGKTTVAVSLAITLAQSGKRVLLVDTDLRRPRVHRAMGVSGATGMTNTLVGDSTLDQVVQKSEVPGLFVLPCGPIPPNPSELLHTARFAQVLSEARSKFDVVLFDSPPLGAVTDAAIVAPQVQGALVVVKASQTSRDAIRSAFRQLRDVGGRVVGAVLNDVDLSERRYGYGAYYYYRREGYYTADADGGPDRAEAAE